MAKKKLFISWSEERSQTIAHGFRDLASCLLQQYDAFISSKVPPGAEWWYEVRTSLTEADYGVLVLTPENIEKPWVLFEAGALGLAMNNRNGEHENAPRMCPYLCLGVTADQIATSPLGIFQARTSGREETFDLFQKMNQALQDDQVKGDSFRKLFDRVWPDFEQVLNDVAAGPVPPPPDRSPLEERLGVILQLQQSLDRRLQFLDERLAKQVVNALSERSEPAQVQRSAIDKAIEAGLKSVEGKSRTRGSETQPE